VLEEPKAGLFGRLKGEARVRARVRPAQVRQKLDRRDRKRADKSEKSSDRAPKADRGDTADRGDKADRTDSKGSSGSSSDAKPREPREPRPARQRQPKAAAANGAALAPRPPRQPRPPKAAAVDSSNTQQDSKEQEPMDAHQVGEEATRFMTGLIDAFGYTGTVELVEDGDDLELRVHGEELGLLVGPRGTTLQAVQDLARVASQRRLGDHDTRLRVDVGGYRERRRAALGQFAEQMAGEVKESGVARVLEPMSSADRKIIHDTLAEMDGIATRSEGDDPYRRVIIAPAND
jgi:spoIIIJ-associated protein